MHVFLISIAILMPFKVLNANSCPTLFEKPSGPERLVSFHVGSGNHLFLVYKGKSDKPSHIRKFFSDKKVLENDIKGLSLLNALKVKHPNIFNGIEIARVLDYGSHYLNLTYFQGKNLDLITDRLYLERLSPRQKEQYLKNSNLDFLREPPSKLERELLSDKEMLATQINRYRNFLLQLKKILPKYAKERGFQKLEIKEEKLSSQNPSLAIVYRLANGVKDQEILLKADNFLLLKDSRLAIIDPY